jgi:radical SAM superfamily enzyme YgiQ (UPF0313 family)
LERKRSALLINPPVYDVQYWAHWSLPHGLLKIGTYLKQKGYKTKLIDCLATDEERSVKMKKQSIIKICSNKEWVPSSWNVKLRNDERVKFCFGKDMTQLEKEFENINESHAALFPDEREQAFPIPDEIWITSIMTYWWESTRDVIGLCKRYFPNAKIRVGGIYPTVAPEHAVKKLGLRDPLLLKGNQLDIFKLEHMNVDIIVIGEIPDASDLDLDLNLYKEGDYAFPKYTILTTSRGCPHNCTYCASIIINGGRNVRLRSADLVMEEIRTKYAQGIREFCFYEDNILMGRDNLMNILTRIIEDRELKHIELHAPEGVEIRLLTPELLKLMRIAGFRKIYLPLETICWDMNKLWNRNFYDLKSFERVVRMCHEAGFGVKPQELNAFVLFGLPGEDLQYVYDTAVYAANQTGSVIPMLFTPVPGTKLYESYENYFNEQSFDFHHLNGKLLPMLEYNRRQMQHKYDLSHQDYYDIENFMFRINQRVKNRPFRFGDGCVSKAFRNVYINYKSIHESFNVK